MTLNVKGEINAINNEVGPPNILTILDQIPTKAFPSFLCSKWIHRKLKPQNTTDKSAPLNILINS